MRCWSCGAKISGDSQTIEGNWVCDRCGWVSLNKDEEREAE